MRKWILWMDVVLLFTCLALLIIDLQIKSDIVERAKKLEEVISGSQRAPEHSDISGDLHSDLLRGNDAGKPAVASENIPEYVVEGIRPRKRNSAAAKRSAGNGSAGIQSDGEPVGA